MIANFSDCKSSSINSPVASNIVTTVLDNKPYVSYSREVILMNDDQSVFCDSKVTDGMPIPVGMSLRGNFTLMIIPLKAVVITC